MGIFNKTNKEQTINELSNEFTPELVNCDFSNFNDAYDWKEFNRRYRYLVKNVKVWKKVIDGFYKIINKDDSVIFYDVDIDSVRNVSGSELDFNIEKYWRKEFSNRLIRMMKVKGINQYDLADATDCSQSTISNYISGKKTPSSFMLYKLANVFNCNVEFFVDF